MEVTALGSSLSLRTFARLGATVSVLDLSGLGASLSLRSCARLGSSLSLLGVARVGSSLSVFDYSQLGSSLALRAFSRIGSSLSVLDVSHLGSSLALRSLSRLASSFSVLGLSRLASSVAVLGFSSIGSSLSLRSISRMGSSLSVLHLTHLGALLSLRSAARIGATLSIFGWLRLGSSLAVLDVASLGSSVSLRSFARLGASFSVFDFAHLGSSLAVRSYTKLSERTLSFISGQAIRFNSWDTRIDSSASGITAHAHATQKAMTWNSGGGILHGTWSVEGGTGIGTSERRLKKNIRSLSDTLNQRASATRSADVPDGSRQLLQELRPVSFKYKNGRQSTEASKTRFGFIAEELLRVLPEITRTLSAEEETKDQDLLGVVYQDLLAVLTTVLQGLAKDMAVLTPRLASIESRILERKRWKRAKRAKAMQASAAVSVGHQRKGGIIV